MGLSRHPFGATLTLAAFLCASNASAAPTAADRETARTLMDQGRDFRDKGDMKDALLRFSAANDIMHVPTTAFEVARAQVALGLLVEARDTIATLRQIPSDHDSAVFRTARNGAEELDGSLAGRVPTLIVTVKGAEHPNVTIDGVPLQAALIGLPRTVNPGHHIVVATAGGAEGRRELDVREGEHKPVELVVVEATVAPVLVEPPAPATPVAAPESSEDTLPPQTTTSHAPTALAWVGIGVAGAGVIVGAVTGGLSLSKKSTLNGQCPNDICGPSGYSTLDSATSLATVSDVAFGVAGAGAILAIVAIAKGSTVPVRASSSPPSAKLQLAPWVGFGTAGVSGSF